MTGRTYIAPTPARTGALHTQPRSDDMVPGWTLDANLEWNPPGFIDAAPFIAVGSVRALDCVMRVTLGIADEVRP